MLATASCCSSWPQLLPLPAWRSMSPPGCTRECASPSEDVGVRVCSGCLCMLCSAPGCPAPHLSLFCCFARAPSLLALCCTPRLPDCAAGVRPGCWNRLAALVRTAVQCRECTCAQLGSFAEEEEAECGGDEEQPWQAALQKGKAGRALLKRLQRGGGERKLLPFLSSCRPPLPAVPTGQDGDHSTSLLSLPPEVQQAPDELHAEVLHLRRGQRPAGAGSLGGQPQHPHGAPLWPHLLPGRTWRAGALPGRPDHQRCPRSTGPAGHQGRQRAEAQPAETCICGWRPARCTSTFRQTALRWSPCWQLHSPTTLCWSPAPAAGTPPAGHPGSRTQAEPACGGGSRGQRASFAARSAGGYGLARQASSRQRSCASWLWTPQQSRRQPGSQYSSQHAFQQHVQRSPLPGDHCIRRSQGPCWQAASCVSVNVRDRAQWERLSNGRHRGWLLDSIGVAQAS
ncbi:hypothetical protein ABPG77_001473 [Micractinium sp. CCAP 211/92]